MKLKPTAIKITKEVWQMCRLVEIRGVLEADEEDIEQLKNAKKLLIIPYFEQDESEEEK